MQKLMTVRRPFALFVSLVLTTSIACNAPASDALQVFLEAGLEKCQSADRGLYESVMRHIGREPENTVHPETTSYEVCYSRWTHEPMSARMIEGGEAGDIARFNGTYVGTEIVRPEVGAIVQVLDTKVTFDVDEGELSGEIVQTSIVETSAGEGQPYTKSERAVQTLDFEGTVMPSGTVDGSGTTAVDYTLISCQPEENCVGVGPTRSAAGAVGVSLEGMIVDETLTGEVVNSVSGARFSFDAVRTGP